MHLTMFYQLNYHRVLEEMLQLTKLCRAERCRAERCRAEDKATGSRERLLLQALLKFPATRVGQSPKAGQRKDANLRRDVNNASQRDSKSLEGVNLVNENPINDAIA